MFFSEKISSLHKDKLLSSCYALFDVADDKVLGVALVSSIFKPTLLLPTGPWWLLNTFEILGLIWVNIWLWGDSGVVLYMLLNCDNPHSRTSDGQNSRPNSWPYNYSCLAIWKAKPRRFLLYQAAFLTIALTTQKMRPHTVLVGSFLLCVWFGNDTVFDRS